MSQPRNRRKARAQQRRKTRAEARRRAIKTERRHAMFARMMAKFDHRSAWSKRHGSTTGPQTTLPYWRRAGATTPTVLRPTFGRSMKRAA